MALREVLTLTVDAQLYGVHSWLESESHRVKGRNVPSSPGSMSFLLQDEN